MSTITPIAEAFFQACETGGGWAACQPYCTPSATFAAQADALSGITTLSQYTEWMRAMVQILPDASYEIRSFATDVARNNVIAYAVFTGTHTGAGGPVPPTGKKVNADYVYVMRFDGDQIVHLTKVWNSDVSLRQLGWA
jgi:predicted ester cyclase